MLANRLIGTRLALGFSSLIVVALAAFAAAAWLGHRGQVDIADTANSAQSRIDAVYGMQAGQLRLVSAVRNAGLQTDGAVINNEVDFYRKTLAALKQQEDSFARLELDRAERQRLDNAIALRQQAEPLVDEAVRFTMALDGEQAAKTLAGRFAAVQAAWAVELNALADLQRERAASNAKLILSDNRQRLLGLAGVLVLTALGASLFAVSLTRSVTRPLRAAVELATRVAQGDLSARIEVSGRDETAQLLRALQTMTEQLAAMVTSVRESSDTIAIASNEISSGNLDLSSRTEATAASLQQTSATLDQLTEMVERNAGHADAVHTVADRTAGIAESGGLAMQQVVATMTRISESSRRIADIIGTIDGIAFQTNILALNAAVEAARAGEQGRGFAVVASEVRSLAQRVTSAAGEVRTLIGESVARVDDGARLVAGLGGTMTELVQGVTGVRGLIGEISAASAHQTESIRQVNGAVRDIDGTTQQNAALVEQMAASAQSLSGQMQRLTGLVNRFNVDRRHSA